MGWGRFGHRFSRFSLLGLVLLCLLPGCNVRYEKVRHERAAAVAKSPTINIAVVWDRKINDFMLVEGINQAVDEINATGGILGKKIRLSTFFAENDNDELLLAKKIARDPAIAAVIGHRTNAVSASITYEYYGLLFVAPSCSNNNLTTHNFEYTFRTFPSDHDVSDDIARYLKSQGHRKIAIIDDRTEGGKGLADGVMEAVSDVGLQTVVRRHFSSRKRDFKPLCAELTRLDFDALFLSGELPQTAVLIREARQMGLRQRIYGGAALDSENLELIAGRAAQGMVIPTSYLPDLNHPKIGAFIESFQQRYGRKPDARAATGYDTIYLIAEAMRRAETADPAVVASNLRFVRKWQGVTGSFSFDMQGDLDNKEIYFKYLHRKQFIYFDTPTAEEADPDVQPDP